MLMHPDLKPKIRNLEPVAGSQPGTIGVRDPAGVSSVVLTLSEPALFILTQLDGEQTLAQVQQQFAMRYEQPLAFDTLTQLVDHLEQSCFLAGDAFDARLQELTAEYRNQPARPMRDAAVLGIDENAAVLFDEMLADAGDVNANGDRVAGLIAPHLDYARGRPCYARAYAHLVGQAPPDRVVILGTNHFGLGRGVVATGIDFATPLGTTVTDVAFIEQLEARCGDLRFYERDHATEHSIELQVCWLQHIYGPNAFRMAAFLCPDPCGSNGTASDDEHAVGLAAFAAALHDAIRNDAASTLVIAGADFSHVGRYFGDDCDLADAFLADVRRKDTSALDRIADGDAEAFRTCVAGDDNATRICSAGCMYTLLSALPHGRPNVLRYHQAVTPEVENCVTCAAVVVYDGQS